MAVGARLPAGLRPSVAQIEPVVPVVLGLHGLAICALTAVPAWPALPYAGVVGLGVAGLLGWQSLRARQVRAVLLIAVTLVLTVVEPQLVPSMLQWYYGVVAVYPLVLWGPVAWAIGPVAGLCYVVQVASGSVPVPMGVAFLRAGVLTALGLATWSAGVAYRAAASAAEGGRLLAEEAGSRLLHAATHDELTGLANRRLLHEELAATGDAPLALLLLDLDRFQEVNDTLGHRYGDLLLTQVGVRLTDTVGSDGTVVRLGGDEFAVLLPAADEERALAFASRLREDLQEPFLVEEVLIAVDASVGISLRPSHARDGDQLLQLADVAMYAAKGAGRGCAAYRPEMSRQTVDALALLAELRGAVGRGELVLEYQPKVRAGDRGLVGLEALVRWEHPVRGRIMPDTFIPLAERSGVIRPLTAWVLETAVAQCRSWRSSGIDVSISVNLSARDLDQEDLAESVGACLRRSGLEPSALELEVTESFLMADLTRAREQLQALHALGVRLAIDDFGTGMSSLSYLKNLPVDVLKIDKAFVSGMLADLVDTRIVRGIVDLAGSLGLETVAEGVEDEATLEHLAAIGCGFAQGYVISRPMPVDDVAGWCRQHAAIG